MSVVEGFGSGTTFPDAGVEAVGYGFTDEELTALALAADPDAPLDDDAVPLDVYLAESPGLLPQWYMPMGAPRVRRGRWGTVVILGIVAAFLVIEAFGLCSTYGQFAVH